MKKIMFAGSVAIAVSACGGGGGEGSKVKPFDPMSTNLSPPAGLSRSDLKIDGFSIAAGTSLYRLGWGTNTSKTNTYTPNKQIDLNSDEVGMAGNSQLTFKSDGSITLDTENCVTTEDDCSLYREAALAGGYVKMKKVGKSTFEYYKIDKVPYRRGSLTLTDVQKYTNNEARSNFGGTIANVFDIYHLDSYHGIKDGDRSALRNAKYVDMIDGKKDRFHDATAKYYWGKQGVKVSNGDASEIWYPMILAMTTKSSFSPHARLGLFLSKTYRQDQKSGRWGDSYYTTHTVIHGIRTSASHISGIGAEYAEQGGWNGAGTLNGKPVIIRGNVVIRMNPNTQKITDFTVSNMQQYALHRNIYKLDDKTGKAFLSGGQLQLENNKAIDYRSSDEFNGIYYVAGLTENGISSGQSGKFNAVVMGSFYGTNADSTAGSFVMQKVGSNLGDKADNTMSGGYIAKKTQGGS